MMPTTPPSLQLSVTGSKLDLQPSQKVSSLLMNRPLTPATPLPPEGLKQDTPKKPWQHKMSQDNKQETGKKLLVTLNASHDPGGRSNRKFDGSLKKGWKVTLNDPPHPRRELHDVSEHRCVVVRRYTSERGNRHGKKKNSILHQQKITQPNLHQREVNNGKKLSDNGRRALYRRRLSLAKKYFFKWSRKVFGRVSPSVARQHYVRQFKRKSMGVWLELWWVEHKEWKLRIRAECHDRYRLWILVWTAWTRYVHGSQEKRLKMAESGRIYCGRLQRHVWGGWRRYWTWRQKKKKCKDFTKQWHQDTTIRMSWLKWKRVFNVRLNGRAMDLVALNFWATDLQRKTLLKWRAKYNEKMITIRNMVSASRHSDRVLKKTSIRVWLEYVSTRRNKLYLKRIAMDFHASLLVDKYFSCWKSQFLELREMAEFEDLIEKRSKVAICRRMLNQWKYYIVLKEHKLHLIELSEVHYFRTLVSKVLHIFMLHHQLKKKVSHVKQLALKFHVKTKCEEVWRKWLQRCEHNEEISLGSLTRRARNHFSFKLTRKTMEGWLIYRDHCRHWKRLNIMADHYYRENVLPRYFEMFRANVSISIYKAHLMEDSRKFRRETLLSIGFYKWWRESRLSKDVRMLELVALLHWEEITKKRLLCIWKRKCQESLFHYDLEEVATTHCIQWCLRKAFNTWHLQWEIMVTSARTIRTATYHASLKLENRAWMAWKEHIRERRKGHTHRTCADDHYHKCILYKVVQCWKEYYNHACVKSSKRSAALCLHHHWVQKGMLMEWREAVEVTKHNRELLQRAIHHDSHKSMIKDFGKWRTLSVLGKQQRQEEDERVNEAIAHLFRVKKHRIIHNWKYYTKGKISEKANLTLGSHHYHHHLKVKVFVAWHDHHKTLLRKKLMTRQWVWFERSRLLSVCYSRWRIQLMHELMDKQKRILSLWHWSHALEKKVLRAWLYHMTEHRRKAKRYASAMDRHRSWLIGLGVKQWIVAATLSIAKRESEALYQQAKNTKTLLECVRRCAHHWKEMTRRHRPHPPLPVDQPSTHLWSNLARQFHLPDDMPICRPQPRKPDILSCSSFSEFLPRLIQPLPQISQTNQLEGNSCLNLTTEPVDYRGNQFPHSTEIIPESKGEEPSLPSSHPLRNKAIQEEILAMRQEMRQYLHFHIQLKTLKEHMSKCEQEERERVQCDLHKVEQMIRDSEPTVREVAVKINKLLQLCP